MKNTALARLAILATLSCTACDVLDPAEDEVDETRAGYAHAVYAPPFMDVPSPEAEEWMDGPRHTVAITPTGSYTLDDEEISSEQLAEYLGQGVGRPAADIQIAIPEDMPIGQALPLFQLLEERGYEGAWLVDLERFRRFGGASREESLPADAFFRGSVAEDEFPVFVSYVAETDSCRATFNGQALTGDQLYDSAFQHLDVSVQRAGGVDAVMADPAILAALVTTVQAAPNTPWRCVGGATFNLIRAGYPAIRYELVDEE